jgi:ABC-type multidrug transport system ATPase subunit
MVGGGEIRSLSGGERRRVSIGQEIIAASNHVLCLDECTTGE